MAMEVAVSTNFCGYPRRNPFVIHRQRPTSTVKGFGQNSIIPKTRIRRSCHVLAANNPKSDDKGSSCGDSYTSQEDLNYLWKLGAGSIAGAAVIKYGSILFPEITRPNIVEALGMISIPVVVAVLLLIKQSRAER
ncbi:uncharacterized protein LOC115752266 isoform X2 [Rhodamnia argentea]|uniref:Uncharacterized protein LOC115752266 isoform X2 n=1 Tax=Rhodamnia argentea TaxID=178133 RepID=A0A8B8QGI6_9MYRT|nr:uncharacterized protein LOC115752266 isoform X2 [Rhodamnia argentea]